MLKVKNKNMRYIIVIFSLLFFFGCASNKKIINQAEIIQSKENVPTTHGLWYYLPKTVIDIEVELEKTVQKVGPFYRFSQRFVNIADVISEDKEEWTIVNAKIATSGIPDYSKLISILPTGNLSISAIQLTQEGILQSINCKECEFEESEQYENIAEPLISISNVNFDDVPFTEEQLIKTSNAAMAEEVAKEIYRLRSLRKNILMGEVDNLPPDGLAYEKALDEIKRQETAYLELFVGKKEVQRTTKKFKYVPGKEYYTNEVLFRFSDSKGVLSEKDVTGTPVYVEFEVVKGSESSLIENEIFKEVKNRGLIYCFPAVANVKIVDRTVLVAEKNINVAQFGTLLRMPADVLEQSNSGVIMDVSTGAIKKVIVGE